MTHTFNLVFMSEITDKINIIIIKYRQREGIITKITFVENYVN